MIIYGSSNIGKVRKDNQDSYMLDTLQNGIGYAVVCDGMGGASGGKVASLNAVNLFTSLIVDLKPDMPEQQILDTFEKAIKKSNFEIYNKSLNNPELVGMGTTLVGAVVVGNKAYVVNIGDSRCYLLHNDVIKRITKDHSAVQELVDQGVLNEAQARNHPNKNIITRALGVDYDVEYDVFIEDVSKNDFLLLCTDGITNYIDDLEIPFEIIKNPETAPNRLIELSNSRGGADNSTVVIIKI